MKSAYLSDDAGYLHLSPARLPSPLCPNEHKGCNNVRCLWSPLHSPASSLTLGLWPYAGLCGGDMAEMLQNCKDASEPLFFCLGSILALEGR